MTSLQTTLRQLRLSGLAQTLDVRLQEAASSRLGRVLLQGRKMLEELKRVRGIKVLINRPTT